MTTDSRPLVLVADDEPTMLELVVQHVKTLGFQVLEANDGEEALATARARQPDLIILDVMMPGASGWEVCRKVREDARMAHTGIPMVTGIGENLNDLTSPLYGADAHINKPFELAELDAKIRDVLAKRATKPLARTEPEPRAKPAAKAKSAAKPAAVAAAPAKKAATKPAKRKPAATKKAATAKKAAPAKKAATKPAKKKAAPKKAAPAKKKPAPKASAKKQASPAKAKSAKKSAAPKKAAKKKSAKQRGR